MSILQEPTQHVPSVQDAANQVKGITTNIYRQLKQQHTMAFNLIWNNSTYTPQEIVSAFGTDAAALFTLSYQLQQILAGADPTYVILEPTMTPTINPDGTVTLA